MKGMFVKDMEIMRGNMKTFIGVYIIAIFCFLSTSAGPSFLISYVSVLAAVMALNTIASDDMDNGMPYIFTFPISRKEYVKEKYLLGAGMVTVLWAVAVAIAIGVNASGYRMVSWEELIASAAAGLFLAVFANAVLFPVQLKYGSSTGRLVLLVLVFGIMAVGWIGVELCQKMKVDFSGLKNLGLRIWNLGRWNVCPIPMGSEKSKKEASVGIRRNRTETSENEIYSIISLNADLCIRIYKKVPWNQSLGSIFHVVHR